MHATPSSPAFGAPPPSAPRVLIVEDHDLTRRFLCDNLAADGYEPLPAASAAQARRLIVSHVPALAILDLGLPDDDGLRLLRDVRRPESELDPQLPVLIVSGRAGELDRVRGYENGADGYLPKPFSYVELRLQIAALLRRCAGRPGMGRLRVGTIELDPRSREVWVGRRRVHLSKKEFALLALLASAPTHTFTREELLREVWNYQAPGKTRTVDSHAHRLRVKLGAGGARYVVNVWGVGYRLCDSGGQG